MQWYLNHLDSFLFDQKALGRLIISIESLGVGVIQCPRRGTITDGRLMPLSTVTEGVRMLEHGGKEGRTEAQEQRMSVEPGTGAAATIPST
jgi:hypothetical protein